MPKYPSHTVQIPRLNRAIGQLEGIKRMIDEEQYCVDIMTQLRAARSALKSIELGILETHMGACVAEACCSKDEKLKSKRISEVVELLKKYE